MIKLHNSLTKQIEEFIPTNDQHVRIYSCGPTVYDRVHIGNLSAFIFADLLRRMLSGHGLKVTHVMNLTDVDDKTIRRSREEQPDDDAHEALQKTTERYGAAFFKDFETVGNDLSAYTFIKATDEQSIDAMQTMIRELLEQGFAYVAEDGIYFSIDAYKKSGKTYGQLVSITAENTAEARIANDEYDKESAHDFALWKKQEDGEPAWDFMVNGENIAGRPGWHIECSAMSRMKIGQPFDIHTGGVDLKFPHHENEIAQSTAGNDNSTYAKVFLHNEHVLVDNRKMSKSLGNFYTLENLIEKNIDPMAFRLLVLQSHYSNQTNFSFDNVVSATNRLKRWRDIASLRWQTHDTLTDDDDKDTSFNVNGTILAAPHAIREALANNLDTPTALVAVEAALDAIETARLDALQHDALVALIDAIDALLGLQLAISTPDIRDEQKQFIIKRERAREEKNWPRSDELRDQLAAQGIVLRDTNGRTIWTRNEP